MSAAFACSACGHGHGLDAPVWCCRRCGGVLEVQGRVEIEPLTLGEGGTPLVEDDGLFLKLEFLQPTGSFKDRGTAVLVGWMRSVGIDACLDDSSGNAGASLAAYCARAGIRCRLFVPAGASGPKLRQIRACGAELVTVGGSRAEVTRRSEEAAREGTFYASHARHPLIQEGMRGFAREVAAELPSWSQLQLIYPVGQGTLLLGSYAGFRELGALPRLHAAQAEACAPLAGLDAQGETQAEGIRVPRPVRREAVLEALATSGGSVITVSEVEIEEAQEALARRGFYVEPTSAVAYAGWRRLGSPRPALIPLTGSGLKT